MLRPTVLPWLTILTLAIPGLCTREVLPYRDASLPIDERVDDLLSRMTLEEKAGQLFQPRLYVGPDGTLDPGIPTGEPRRNSTDFMLGTQYLTHFSLTSQLDNVTVLANWYNLMQERAAETRLGIPVSLSSDPRHSFTDNVNTGFEAGRFSQWPEMLGLAALRDPGLVKAFARVARREYVAIGLRTGLHPQVDLATEARWPRIGGTFGEDAELVSELAAAYVEGFQDGPKPAVTVVVKHFPGGGPMENGEDSHFVYGANQTYPGDNFDYFLQPFKAAIASGARAIMPGYGRPIGTKYEEVGFAFNKGIITDLLRGELGFDGIVVTDWHLITDTITLGVPTPAKAWGLTHLSETEKMARIFDAGCDQLGGESRPELLVELVEKDILTEDRVDISVRRVLKEKFVLGLFENPYVDVDAANDMIGNECFVKLGQATQRRSYTLLSNNDNFLPLRNIDAASTKLYIEGFDATFATNRGFTVVSTPEEADYAFLRLGPPFEPRFVGTEAFFQAGTLQYSQEEKERQAAIYAAVPTVVDIALSRPAAIPEVIERAAAVLGNYGASSDAFLDIALGISSPEGRLPFDLPRSDEAVINSLPDVPFDTEDPVFRFGHGLRYE